MIAVILIALMIMPLSALFFGALFFRQKMPTVKVSVYLVTGLLVLCFEVYKFYKIYEVTFQKSEWASSAMTMGGWYPFTLTLNVLFAGLVGAALYSLWSKAVSKKSVHAQMSFVTISSIVALFVATLVIQMSLYSKQQVDYAIVQVASGDLTQEKIDQVVTNYKATGNSSAMLTMLANPSLSPEQMYEYYNNEDTEFRIAILRNPNVPEDIVEKLSTDNNDMVRYHVAINPKVSKATLERFLTDHSKDVRLKSKSILEDQI